MKKQINLRNSVITCVFQLKTIIFILLLIHLTGCGFQGRKYTHGNYWNSRTEIYVAQGNYDDKKDKGIAKEIGQKNIKLAQNNRFIAYDIDTKTNEKDTLKISKDQNLTHKNTSPKEDKLNAKEHKIQQDETPNIDGREKKLQRAKNSFMTFWSIESLLYLGLLGNLYSPDIWGFWLFVFGSLTAIFLFFTLIFMVVMKIRYSKSKDLVKNEELKSKIPKLLGMFVLAIVLEVGLLLAAFVL